MFTATAALALLISCGTARRAAQNEGTFVPLSELYSEDAMATYFYSEGLKNMLMLGKPEDSELLFKKALESDSTYAPALYELADLSRAKPDSGLYYIRRAFESDTTNVWYRTLLGQMLIASGQYDSAMTVYSSLMKVAPNNPDNYSLLAALYEQQAQPFSAIAILDSAEKVFGPSPEISGFKRQLLIDVKLYDQAIAEAVSMAENDPFDHTNYIVLAELYSAIGKDSLALDSYDKALEINPDNIETIMSMNDHYKRKNDNMGFMATARQLFASDEIDLPTKIRFFEDITRSQTFYQNYYPQIDQLAATLFTKYPKEAAATDLYAGHLSRTGYTEEALVIYKSELGDSLPRLETYNNILNIEAYLQRPDSVNKYSSLAIEHFPDNTDLYMRKGAVLSYFLKDYKGAETEYKKALKYAASDSLRGEIYGIIGDGRHSMGNNKSAYKYYEKGLKYSPKNSMLLNNYAYYLSETGHRLEEAERMSIEANKLTGDGNATYLDTQAWILYKLGRYEEAAAVMKKAVALDTSSSDVLLFHYGEILYAIGDRFMASVYWKKALDSGYDPDIVNERLKLLEKQ